MDEILHTPAPAKARIEIIPLIDVIFFLLATFVLFTLSLNRIQAIDLTLPVPGPRGPADENVYIQASADGTFYWKQGSSSVPEPITAAEIGPRLAEYKRSALLPSVFVRGDNKATFGPAVFVLDEVRKARISRVSLETLTSSTGK
ncbi:MAG TPA: biopolymer transporter ExbD [Opitutaceae bacterium]|nr:biopolymer transporter ExbD [Opitutaceae bacterium]